MILFIVVIIFVFLPSILVYIFIKTGLINLFIKKDNDKNNRKVVKNRQK